MQHQSCVLQAPALARSAALHHPGWEGIRGRDGEACPPKHPLEPTHRARPRTAGAQLIRERGGRCVRAGSVHQLAQLVHLPAAAGWA